MTIFINGKQKRVKRPPTVAGLPIDEFIRRNEDPIWLLQNEMYEELHQWESAREDSEPQPALDSKKVDRLDDDLPF